MWTTPCLYAVLAWGMFNTSPSWHHDYGHALTRAQAAQKPVAVFIGSGVDGWKTACQEGELGLEVRRLLANHYVCVYVDADPAAGQSVARSFEAGRSPLVVLSSHNGAYQAYRHSGKLANASLAQALQRHASEDVLDEYEEAAALPPVLDASSEIFSYAPTCRT